MTYNVLSGTLGLYTTTTTTITNGPSLSMILAILNAVNVLFACRT